MSFAMKALLLTDSDWWAEIRYRTLDPGFSLQRHMDIMYPKLCKKLRTRYPKRHVLSRVIKCHEKWALQNLPTCIDQTLRKTIAYTSDKSILAKPGSVRLCLTEWLPASLKSTKLDLIYSTDIHGRSLASLCKQCERSKNTVLLVEALHDKSSSLIGMFATHAWITQPRSYGDNGCFLFRAHPNPKCFKWMQDLDNIKDLENQAVSEQLMVCNSDFIAMGANTNGTNGLRLDKELIKGESHPALGFKNDPLPGDNQRTFDIGHLEVYRLIRDIE